MLGYLPGEPAQLPYRRRQPQLSLLVSTISQYGLTGDAEYDTRIDSARPASSDEQTARQLARSQKRRASVRPALLPRLAFLVDDAYNLHQTSLVLGLWKTLRDQLHFLAGAKLQEFIAKGQIHFE